MRVVLQKVNRAQVSIYGTVVGKIAKGYMLLVGFAPDDGDEQLDYLVHKIVNLRVFEDENGKMNKGLKDVDGAILSISQFTLYADTNMVIVPVLLGQPAEIAELLYECFRSYGNGVHVETGRFGLTKS